MSKIVNSLDRNGAADRHLMNNIKPKNHNVFETCKSLIPYWTSTSIDNDITNWAQCIFLTFASFFLQRSSSLEPDIYGVP